MKFVCILFGILVSCGSQNMIRMVDNKTNPSQAINQIELGNVRGRVMLAYYNKNSALYESGANQRYNSYKSKEWVLRNWGNPDNSYQKNEMDFLVYSKKDKASPNYDMQFLRQDRPVVLGYKNNILVYVEISAQDKQRYGGQNPYFLPQ